MPLPRFQFSLRAVRMMWAFALAYAICGLFFAVMGVLLFWTGGEGLLPAANFLVAAFCLFVAFRLRKRFSSRPMPNGEKSS
jgi:hypothetical protein